MIAQKEIYVLLYPSSKVSDREYLSNNIYPGGQRNVQGERQDTLLLTYEKVVRQYLETLNKYKKEYIIGSRIS